ncbi:MAG: hypothetical protein HY242_05290 [Afipia sp.]|nr:hypothetical protein [Afipia sp.]
MRLLNNAAISGTLAIRAFGVVILMGVLANTGDAKAAVASEALENCRAAIGRPVVRACIHERLQNYGGMPLQYLAACRQIASPAVRECFQTAMKDVIESCRASVGKPIVQECVGARVRAEGRFLFDYIADCRKTAFTAVRACIWRTSAGGPPPLQQ